MTPDTGILTTTLENFLTVFNAGIGKVQVDAQILLRILASLELIFVSLWWAYSGNDALGKLLRKILIISFFIWVIDYYGVILDWVIAGFTHTGESAAGASIATLEDPSKIVDAGFKVCLPILVHAQNSVGFSVSGIVNALVTVFCLFLILLSYFVLAIQIFITRIEFGLITTLGLILIPFGVFKPTTFMAERMLGAVIAYGVKLMVLAFIIAISFPLLANFTLPDDPSWPEMLHLLVPSLAIMMLSLHAPGVAAGLLSGAPTLTAGSGIQTATTAGAGAFIGAKAGAATVGKGGVAAMGATFSGAKSYLSGFRTEGLKNNNDKNSAGSGGATSSSQAKGSSEASTNKAPMGGSSKGGSTSNPTSTRSSGSGRPAVSNGRMLYERVLSGLQANSHPQSQTQAHVPKDEDI